MAFAQAKRAPWNRLSRNGRRSSRRSVRRRATPRSCVRCSSAAPTSCGLNFSHGTPAEHAEVIRDARAIAAELGIHIALLQDLPGPKVRTGTLADGAPSVRLARGARFVVTLRRRRRHARARRRRHYRDLPADVAIGNRIYLQDGQIALRIVGRPRPRSKRSSNSAAICARPGHQLSRRTLHVDVGHRTRPRISGVRPRAGRRLRRASRSCAAPTNQRVKAFIAERGKNVPVIAKIEKHEALEDLDGDHRGRRRHHGRPRRSRHRDPARNGADHAERRSSRSAIARANRS